MYSLQSHLSSSEAAAAAAVWCWNEARVERDSLRQDDAEVAAEAVELPFVFWTTGGAARTQTSAWFRGHREAKDQLWFLIK